MKIFIKYMVSNRCKMAVKEELNKLGLHFIVVDLGEVEIMETLTASQQEALKLALLKSGLELMDDKRAVLIERVKNVITEMIHHSDESPKVNYSDYISGKLDYDYTYLSNLFSEVKGITIQQFIIINFICLTTALLLTTLASNPVMAASRPTTTSTATPAETAAIQVLLDRLNEIKAMDKSTLSRTEKMELRKEVRSTKEALRERHYGGIYISAGAIIIILLLIILL